MPMALVAGAATMGVGVPLPISGEVLPDLEAGVARANSATTTAEFRTTVAAEGGEGEGRRCLPLRARW